MTFWEELPPHRHGTVVEIADVLRRLHDLPLPTGLLDPLDPFVRLAERIDAGTGLPADDRAWLHARLGELRDQYRALPAGLPLTVVHGDAWGGWREMYLTCTTTCVTGSLPRLVITMSGNGGTVASATSPTTSPRFRPRRTASSLDQMRSMTSAVNSGNSFGFDGEHGLVRGVGPAAPEIGLK